MRGLRWAWLPLFLGSCIVIPLPHRGGTVEVNAQQEVQARAAIQAAASAATLAKLQRYACHGTRGCYPLRDVNARVEAIRKQLQSIPDEAVALKLWLQPSGAGTGLQCSHPSEWDKFLTNE